MGFNPKREKGTCIVTECDELYSYICGYLEYASFNIITNDCATILVEETIVYTEYHQYNVYLSIYNRVYKIEIIK